MNAFHRLTLAAGVLLLLSCVPARAAGPSTGGPGKGDDRRAAEWVLSKGGNVAVVSRDKESRITTGQALPSDAFQITRLQIQNTEAPKNENAADFAQTFGPKLITAEELAALAGLSKLEEVQVNGVAASPGFFDTLKTLPKLRSVRWYGDATLTDAHLKRFQELRPLEKVHLGGSQNLTIAGLANLINAQPALSGLDIKNCLVADDAVPHLLKLRKLKSLDTSYSRMTPGGIAPLAGLPALEALILSGDQCVAGIDWSKFPSLSLVQLWFDERIKIHDSGLEHLATCRKLETLHLEGTSDLSLVQMRLIGAMRNVRRLVCYRFVAPDGSWSSLASMGKLESLEVHGVHPFNDRDLMSLANNRSLKRITTSGTKVTDAGVAAFKKKRGDVTVTVTP